MVKAINDSNHRTPEDRKGGFHEEYGIAGLDEFNNWVVSRDTPGPYGNPATRTDLPPSGTPVDKDKAESIRDFRAVFHVHPRGITPDGHYWNQPPSDKDEKEAIPGQINIVFAAGEKKVYFYDQWGVIGKPMDLKDFLRQPYEESSGNSCP